MTRNSPVFLGIDLGTGGVRALAVDEQGSVLASANVNFPPAPGNFPEGHHEQQPEVWWQTACRALGRLTDKLTRCGISPDALRGAAIDGTSGTLVLLDRDGHPVRPALMYNDSRGAEQASQINAVAGEFIARHGYSFSSSFAAAKLRWLQEHEPQAFSRGRFAAHQADYLAFRLTGDLGLTDFNNALKTGYDLLEDRWPDWLTADSAIADRLPEVLAPGTSLGRVSKAGADATGLPPGLPILAGTTDGVAAALASGLNRPGQYNTSLGTTLVFKGLSDTISADPRGLVYSHKLPGGRWLPGAASNTGGQWIGRWFGDADWAAMDHQAPDLLLSAPVAYPLARSGERFPFAHPQASGFFVRQPAAEPERYAACLLGTALVERLAYEVLDRVTGQSAEEIYATGGGSRSDVWSQCRADVTGLPLNRPACTETAFGAAVLVASGVSGDALDEVVRKMVHIEKSFFPNVSRAVLYQERFEEFGKELRRRGYL